MALDKIQVTVEPVLNTTSLDAAINRVQGRTLKVRAEVQDPNFEQKIGRPLGRITGQVDEFKKSLDAANARVLAFGASVGVIGLISSAFKDLINSTIEVEKNLALLKVTGDKTFGNLEKTGKGVFQIAKDIGVSFAEATNATIEFSRQGKDLQQSLDAARAALVLVKTTGLDAVSSVNGLTTAVNAFSDSGLTYADVVNKMAAVDTKFAVNSKDLIEGIGRSASVAQQAGVSFNELLGFITALQEKTGRGGPVIGNALKTIFTRIQNPAIINQLREFNIELQDTEGNGLSALQILKNFAKEFDKLKGNDKARAILDVGGTFQIDKIAALIKDLSSANSKFDQATATSANAKNEAYGKVIELNKTLDSSLIKLNTSAKEFGSAIGSIAFADSFKETVNYISSKFDSLNQSINGTKTLEERLASGDGDGEKGGATLGKAILKGIGSVISGPGLLLLGGILIKLSADFAKFSASGLQTLLGITTKSKEEESIEESIVNKLRGNVSLQRQLYSLGDDKIAQNKELLRLYTEQYNANKKLTDLAKGAAPALYESGVRLTGGELTVKNLQTTTKASASANGYVPNFNSLNEAVSYEKANMPAGASVKVNKNFPFGGGKYGTMVSNTSEFEIPNFMNTGGTAIIPRYKNAVSGYVPNFADTEKKKTPRKINEFQIDAEKYGIAGLTLGSDSYTLERSKAKVLKDENDKPTKWVRDNFSDSPLFNSLMNYDKAVVTNLPVGGVYKASSTLKSNEKDVKANFVNRLNKSIGSSSLAFLINEINNLKIPLTNSFKQKLYSTEVGSLNLIDNGLAGNFFEKVVKLPLMQNEKDFGFKKETGSNFDIYGLSAPDAKVYGLPERSFRYGEIKFSSKDLYDDITEKFLNQAKLEVGGSVVPKTSVASSAAHGYVPNFAATGFVKNKDDGPNVVEEGKIFEKNFYNLLKINMDDRPKSGAPLDLPKGILDKYDDETLSKFGVAVGSPFRTSWGDIKLSHNKESALSLISKYFRYTGTLIDESKKINASSENFSMLYKNGPEDIILNRKASLPALVNESPSLFRQISEKLRYKGKEELNKRGQATEIDFTYNADRVFTGMSASAHKGYIPNFAETKLGEGYSAAFYDLGSGIGEKRFFPEILEEDPKKAKTEATISKKLEQLNSKLKIVRFPKIFGSTATSIKKEVVTDPLAAKVFDGVQGPSDVKKMLQRRLQETLRIALAPVQIAGIVPQDLNENNYTVNSNIQALLGNILNSHSGIPSAEDLYRQINASGGMMTMIDPGEFYKDKPNKKELEKFQKYKEQGLLENAYNGYVPNYATAAEGSFATWSDQGRSIRGTNYGNKVFKEENSTTDFFKDNDIRFGKFDESKGQPYRDFKIEQEYLMGKALERIGSKIPGVRFPKIFGSLQRSLKDKTIRKEVAKGPLASSFLDNLTKNSKGVNTISRIQQLEQNLTSALIKPIENYGIAPYDISGNPQNYTINDAFQQGLISLFKDKEARRTVSSFRSQTKDENPKLYNLLKESFEEKREKKQVSVSKEFLSQIINNGGIATIFDVGQFEFKNKNQYEQELQRANIQESLESRFKEVSTSPSLNSQNYSQLNYSQLMRAAPKRRGYLAKDGYVPNFTELSGSGSGMLYNDPNYDVLGSGTSGMFLAPKSGEGMGQKIFFKSDSEKAKHEYHVNKSLKEFEKLNPTLFAKNAISFTNVGNILTKNGLIAGFEREVIKDLGVDEFATGTFPNKSKNSGDVNEMANYAFFLSEFMSQAGAKNVVDEYRKSNNDDSFRLQDVYAGNFKVNAAMQKALTDETNKRFSLKNKPKDSYSEIKSLAESNGISALNEKYGAIGARNIMFDTMGFSQNAVKTASSGYIPNFAIKDKLKAGLPILKELAVNSIEGFLNLPDKSIDMILEAVAKSGHALDYFVNDTLNGGNAVKHKEFVIKKMLERGYWSGDGIVWKHKETGKIAYRPSTINKIINKAADGYVPNFSKKAVQDAVEREQKQSGLPLSDISVVRDSRVMGPQNPGGFAVINKRDEPNGKVPNFAGRSAGDLFEDLGGKLTPEITENVKATKALTEVIKKITSINSFTSSPASSKGSGYLGAAAMYGSISIPTTTTTEIETKSKRGKPKIDSVSSSLLIPQGQAYDLSNTSDKDHLSKEENAKRIEERIKTNSFSLPPSPIARQSQNYSYRSLPPIDPNTQKSFNPFLKNNFASELFPYSPSNEKAEALAVKARIKIPLYRSNVPGVNKDINESRLVGYSERGQSSDPITQFKDLKESVLKSKENFNKLASEIAILSTQLQKDGKEMHTFQDQLAASTKFLKNVGIDISPKLLSDLTKGTAFEQTEKQSKKSTNDALVQRAVSLSEVNPNTERNFQMQAQAFAAERQRQRYAQYAQAQTNVYGSFATPNVGPPTTQDDIKKSLYDRMKSGVGSIIGSSKVLTEQEKAQKLEKDKLIAQEKANKSMADSFATIMKWQTGIAALTGAVSVLGEGATVAATSIGSLFNSVILAKEGMSGAKDILGKTTYEYTTASGEKKTGERNKTFGESFNAINKKIDEGMGTGDGAGTGFLGIVGGIKNAKGEIGTFAKAAGIAALSWGTVAFQAIQNIDQVWKYLDNGAEKSKKAIAKVAEMQDKYNISLGRSQESVAKMISVIGDSDTEGLMGAFTRAGIIFGREQFGGQDKQTTALAQFKFGNEGTKVVAGELSKIMSATASTQMSEQDKKNPLKVAIEASKLQGNFLENIINKYSNDVVSERQVPMTAEELKSETLFGKLVKMLAFGAGPGNGAKPALPGMKLEVITQRVLDASKAAEMQSELFDELQKQAQLVLPKINEEEKRRASILGVSVDTLKVQLDLYTKITKAINDTKTGLEFNLEIEKDDLGTTQKRKDEIELQLKLLQKEKEIRSQKNDIASSVSQKEIFDRLKGQLGGLTEPQYQQYSESFKSINLGIQKGDTSSQSAEKLADLLTALGVQSSQLKQEAADLLNSQLSSIDIIGNKDKLLLKLETDKLQVSKFYKYEQDQIKERLEAQLTVSQKNLAVRKEEASIIQNIKDLQFKTSIAELGPRTQELLTKQREPENQLQKDNQALQFRREESFQSTKRNVINYVTQSNPEIFKDEKAAAALYGSKSLSDLKDALIKVKQLQEEQAKVDPIKLSGDYFSNGVKRATDTLESAFDIIGKKFAEKLGLPSFDVNKPAELKLEKQFNKDNFLKKGEYSDAEMGIQFPLTLFPTGTESLSNPLGEKFLKPISLGKTNSSELVPFDAKDLFSTLTPTNSNIPFKQTEIVLRSVDSALKTSTGTATKTTESAKKAEEAVRKVNIDEFFKSFLETIPDKAIRDEIKAKYENAIKDRQTFVRRSTTFSGGMEESKLKMDEDIKYFNNTLGKQIPNDFASSMKDALKELSNPNSTEPLKNRLLGVANAFLLKIQDAFMTQAANQITSGIMGIGGKAAGGPIVGGSGVKDDVPAMLMGGEYVITKSAAQKYGPEFLSALNRGSIKKFATGGFVESDTTKYQDTSKITPYGQTRDKGLSFDASGKVIGMDSYTGTADNKEDAMRKAQSDYYYKNAQNGEGGFYMPGQNGMGAIMGQKNLLAFATQQSAGTKFDKFSSGANSAGIDLGAGSANMSLFALRNQGNSKNTEYSEAKQKALDLYLGGIDASKEKANKEEDIRKDIEKAIQEYKTAERKQYQSLIRNFVISAAMAGISYAGNKMMTTGGQEAQSGKIESINNEIDTKGYSNQGISQNGEIYSASNRASIDNTRITSGEKFFGYEGKGGFFRGSLSGDNNKFISNGKGMYSWDGGGYSRMNDNSFSGKQWAQMNYSAKPIQIGGETYYPASMGRRAAGGYVPGNGMGDNVPTMLNGGEFVVSKQATQNIGINKLQQINSGSKSSDVSEELLSKLDELVEKLSAVGTLNITVNSDSSGNQKSSKESSNNQDQQTKDLAKRIKDVVLGVLREEKRLGGMLR